MNRLLLIGLIIATVIIGIILLNDTRNQTTQEAQQLGNDSAQPETQSNTDVNLQQRANLHKILQEHAITASMHLQNLYDEKDTTETENMLGQNTKQFIELMTNISNNSNQSTQTTTQLETIWRGHIQEYEAYTQALMQNNTEQKEEARNNLQMHAEDFGNAVNALIPNVPAENATGAMNEHANLTLSIIDAHAEENTAEKMALSTQASAQAAGFAETLIPNRQENNR